MSYTIKTNYHFRPLLSAYDLTEKELSEFDYIDNIEEAFDRFFRYKGEAYDSHEFQCFSGPFAFAGAPDNLKEWDGFAADSYFSGMLVRYAREGSDHEGEIQVASFYC